MFGLICGLIGVDGVWRDVEYRGEAGGANDEGDAAASAAAAWGP